MPISHAEASGFCTNFKFKFDDFLSESWHFSENAKIYPNLQKLCQTLCNMTINFPEISEIIYSSFSKMNNTFASSTAPRNPGGLSWLAGTFADSEPNWRRSSFFSRSSFSTSDWPHRGMPIGLVDKWGEGVKKERTHLLFSDRFRKPIPHAF